MRRIEDQEWIELAPVPVRHPRDWSATGLDVDGWKSSVWILHAMYEKEDVPAGRSHDDVDRIERAATGESERMRSEGSIGEVLADMVDGSTVIGSPLGASSCPGEGWKRLEWTTLADRLNLELFSDRRFPGFRTFPYESWPASIRPPAEGSLDAEQFVSLVEQLEVFSPGGVDADCIWWYSPIWHSDSNVFRGSLGEAAELYMEDARGAPNNFWPTDHGWFAWTDFDLWATKVSGPRELADSLLACPELEAVEIEFEPGTP